MAEISKGIPVSSKPNTVLLEELLGDYVNYQRLQNYKSWQDTEARCRLHLLPALGKPRAAQITTSQWRAYRLMRLEEGAVESTVNRELEATRAAYYLAFEATPKKILFVPKFPIVSEKKFIRTGFFEREKLEAVCRQLPKHLTHVARCYDITGWRHQEVVNRCWEHVTAEGLHLFPGETKNDEGRTFPMVAELKALLDELRPKHVFPGQRIFTRPVTRKAKDGKTETLHLPIKRFDKAWSTACRKAGLPVRWVPVMRRSNAGDPDSPKVLVLYKRGKKKGQPVLVARASLYIHDFRRTAFRRLVRRGIPESIARAAVGWLDPKTAERYNIVAQADPRRIEGAL